MANTQPAVREKKPMGFIRDFIVSLSFFLLLTIPFWLWDIDISMQRFFFTDGEWSSHSFWLFLYNYGPAPAMIVSVLALLFWFIATFTGYQRCNRRVFAFISLLMILGPGLVINAIFKEYWGRPRPRQIIEFGGQREHVPPLVMGEFVAMERYEKMLESSRGAAEWDILRNLYHLKGKYNSFPNGHASAGFFMMFPYFIYRHRSRVVAFAWLLGGSSFGLLMGVGRMAQGGHFASDTLWAGAMVYLTGTVLYHVLHLRETEFRFHDLIAAIPFRQKPPA